MGINALLNQTITIAAHSTRDYQGKSSFSAPVTARCRFEQVKKTIVNAQKETEPIDGIVFVPGDTSVSTGDKVTFNAQTYRVMVCSPIVDGRGTTRHIELKVQLWV